MSDARRPDHPVAPFLAARWSPRSFTDAPMTEAQVMSLLEAARWAPSASNNQPWRMVWALRGEAAFAAILGTLAAGNQVWAGRAAALIAVASRDTVLRDGAEAPNRWAAFDTGAAWMSLALQAREMGLAAHAMGGFDAAELAGAVALPAGHSLQAVVAVGTQGLPEALPEPLRSREAPGPRMPVEGFSHRGRF